MLRHGLNSGTTTMDTGFIVILKKSLPGMALPNTREIIDLHGAPLPDGGHSLGAIRWMPHRRTFTWCPDRSDPLW